MIGTITRTTLLVLLLGLAGDHRHLSLAEQVEHFNNLVDPNCSSVECLICHDGMTAQKAYYCTVPGACESHPVMRPYPAFRMEDFTTPEFLESLGIVLENGQIGCISCHNLLVTTPKQLRMDNSGSQLCFACHHR